MSSPVDGVNYAGVTKRNKTNLEAVPDKGTTSYVQVRDAILIGGGHEATSITAVQQAKSPSAHNGAIVVRRGNGADPGALSVSGAVRNRPDFEREIKKFSKKKVTYVD